MKTVTKELRKQPMPDEVLSGLQEFLRARFYPGAAVTFSKDLPRLRQWVIFYPARWLYGKGVTLPSARYREILQTVLLDALAHQTGDIKYLPAWMKMVVESHFKKHGDPYYEEGKAMRNQIEHSMMAFGKLAQAAPDIASEFAKADRLLRASKPKKTATKPPAKAQLKLL